LGTVHRKGARPTCPLQPPVCETMGIAFNLKNQL
jgi:hypothetical protein